jgi:CheY-like chemotaxis protein
MPVGVQKNFSPKRILVVEDGPEVAKAIRMVLAIGGGHKVETVEDGQTGLDRFEPGKYDLVITDLHLPKMRGTELARAIKERSPTQRIILITGYANAINEDSEAMSKIDLLLVKPFSLEQLQDALAEVFSPPQAQE